MLWRNNAKLALASLKSAKWRSFLTMLGIIIGVVSVVTTVSIGEGVKQQVNKQISQLGPDLITVRPGKVVNRDANGSVTGYNVLGLIGAGNLNETDWQGLQKIQNARLVVPMNLVPGVLKSSDRTYDEAVVIGAPAGVPEVLNQELAYGTFYENSDANKGTAVIGKRVAEKFFQENVPIGKSFEFRGRNFMVRGVFDEFPASPLTPTADYNNAIFIPYDISKEVAGGQTHIYQILLKPTSPDMAAQLSNDVRGSLKASRGGQEDFTVLRQDENISLADSLLTLLTTMIAAVAAVSLIVGGIGIMNVMLVSVTERTHEIGIRKAVGATNQQILSQFLLEAAVLSSVGGVVGVLMAVIVNYLLRIFTDIQPVITLQIVLVATAVSLVVGIMFGITPALRAARKDPIEALRSI
ncbi:ABC transporter permease [Candidatus Saccharibacteria bacterium]|nr:ABC transporter permease [Candidatus Saccharibacteria bacterium]